jgi:hypothetical protein
MRDRHDEHLDVLAVLHYVLAGIMALFSLIPVIHFLMSVAMVFAVVPSSPDPMLPVAGAIMMAVSLAIIGGGLAVSGLILWTGLCLHRRRHYVGCMVGAGVACMFMPLGTVLGVFTLVVLQRPEVRGRFEGGSGGGGAAGGGATGVALRG